MPILTGKLVNAQNAHKNNNWIRNLALAIIAQKNNSLMKLRQIACLAPQEHTTMNRLSPVKSTQKYVLLRGPITTKIWTDASIAR